ncbi:hypothetical protein [Streptomyces avermitilis]|uniref:hypothetical protein n=1 Tax=Streptomyces avermitilis TaxID=33903 RepID=UPI0033BE65E6
MKQILQGLLDQLEPVPPHGDGSARMNPDAAERELQHLAGQASELVRHPGQFAAGRIRREPVAEPARHLARLARQAAHTAVRVDPMRGDPSTANGAPRS